jgi:predicted nucleotidyltransferase
MKITAITAEFNPLHKGHLYPLNYAKSNLSSDFVIALMSPSFVQRGECAFFSKQNRVRMALEAGYDMVIELPLTSVLSSAETYAEKSLRIMKASNIVDSIVFGAETDDAELLKRVSDLLCNEPPIYKDILRKKISSGATYARAVFESVSEILHLKPEETESLTYPNNILAIEYLKSNKRLGLNAETYAISRAKGDYHSTNKAYSAEYIRSNYNSFDEVVDILPTEIVPLYKELVQNHEYALLQDYDIILKLGLINYFAENEPLDDLEKRIQNHLYEYETAESFIKLIKTKNYAYTAVSRKLFSLLLNPSKLYFELTNYIRVLGFRSTAKPLLSLLKEKASVPVILNTAKDKKSLSHLGQTEFDLNAKADDIYNTILTAKTHKLYKNEFSSPYPIIIN